MAQYSQLAEKLPARFISATHVRAGDRSEVFRAWDKDASRAVAIKVPRRQHQQDWILREAETLGRASHDGLPRLVDVFPAGTRTCLAMDYCPYPRLDDVLAHGPQTLRFSLRTTMGVLDALTALHVLGIVHRDISSANVLVDPSTAAVFLVGLRLCGSVLEPADGDAGTKGDVHAAARLLYEMLAGESLLGRRGESVLGSTCAQAVLRSLPSGVRGVVRDALTGAEGCTLSIGAFYFEMAQALRAT
jgi:serine/threonine protein kinase